MKRRRRCSDCGVEKPLTRAYFYTDKRRATGGRQSYMRVCKECHKERVRERRRRQKAEDPEGFRARHAAWNADWRRRNVERSRGYQKAYRERIRKDPQRWRAHLENQRISYRLRQERRGRPLEAIRPGAVPDVRGDGGLVPVAPLVPFVRAWLATLDLPEGDEGSSAVTQIGVQGRRWFDWRTGRATMIRFDVADRVIVALDLLPFDVWDDPDVLALWGIEVDVAA